MYMMVMENGDEFEVDAADVSSHNGAYMFYDENGNVVLVDTTPGIAMAYYVEEDFEDDEPEMDVEVRIAAAGGTWVYAPGEGVDKSGDWAWEPEMDDGPEMVDDPDAEIEAVLEVLEEHSENHRSARLALAVLRTVFETE